jgi:hypothetical protein
MDISKAGLCDFPGCSTSVVSGLSLRHHSAKRALLTEDGDGGNSGSMARIYCDDHSAILLSNGVKLLTTKEVLDQIKEVRSRD